MKISLLLIVVFMAGCASDKVLLKGSGIEAPPMEAATRLCLEKPWLEICHPEAKEASK